MKSIRRRLIVGVLVATVVIFGIAAVGLDAGIRFVLVREFDAASKARALTMAALTTGESGHLEMELTSDLTAEFAPKDRAAYFQLWRADGSTFARSASLGPSRLIRPVDVTATPRFWNLTLPDGEDGRAVGFQFVPAPAASNALPLTLVMARRLDPVDDTLEALRVVLLVVCVGILTALIVTIRQAVRRGLAPLAVVAERAANINASSLSQRFPANNLPAELAPICRRLNDLLARLEQSFDRERQFTADAAHELRTPITELRSLAEVSLKWPDDAAATQQAFQDVLEIAGNMESIVNGLLTLARCESGKQNLARAPVALSELVEENWRPLTWRATTRHLDVTCEVPASVHLETDRALCGIILTNILANAVEYTPDGGQIRIQGDRHAGRFSLSVTNTVNNLTVDDLPHLFERFWRKDAARTTAGHSGLGLSLAKAFADLLGLALTATLTDSTLVMALEGTATQSTHQQERGVMGR